MSGTPSNVWVLGIGNLLMGDDGVGCHAIAAMRDAGFSGAMFADAGTAVIRLLAEVERAEAVLFVDAFEGGGAPGTLYRMDARDVAKPARRSLHDVGLPALMTWMREGDPARPLVLLGVEPASVEYGTELSEAVAAALPAVLAEVRRFLASPSTYLHPATAEAAP